jgi:hypothetical protein
VAYTSANLREGPGTSFEIVSVLTQGDTVDVFAKTDDGTWYNVSLDDGTLGWLAASAVEDVQDMDFISIAETIPALQETPIQTVSSGWAENCYSSWRYSSDTGYPQIYPSQHTTQNSTVYGQDPIIFSWPSCQLPNGYYYNIVVLHTDMVYQKGDSSPSYSFNTSSNSTTISLPLDRIGSWEWTIEVRDQNGDVATFVSDDTNRIINVRTAHVIGFFYDPYSSP